MEALNGMTLQEILTCEDASNLDESDSDESVDGDTDELFINNDSDSCS